MLPIFSKYFLILDLISSYKRLFVMNMLVILIAALFEGVGIGMLVPIMEVMNGAESANTQSTFGSYLKEFFSIYGVQYEFTNLMSIFALLMLLKYMFLVLQQRLTRILSATVTRDLRCDSIENILDVSLGYFHSKKIGEIISTVYNSTLNSGGVLEYIMMIIKGGVFIITYVALASMLSFELTFLVCTSVMLVYFFVVPRFKKSREYGTQEKKIMDDILSYLHDKFAGLRVLKLFNLENSIFYEIEDKVTNYKNIQIKITDNKLIAYIFFEPFLFLLLVIAVITAFEVFQMPLSVLIVVLLIFVQIIPQFKVINSNVMMINELLPHYKKVLDIMGRDNKVYLPNGETNIDNINKCIEIKNLSFYFDVNDVKVLNNINLEIQANTTVAFVGSSGSGKSTLVDLITRIYDPKEGEIRVDGNNLKDIDMASWKKIIGIVDQDCYLFHDSILNNIKYGKLTATDDEIVKAAKKAYAHDFIDELEDGYKTIIGNRGARLSGGQKQRIALARALVRNSKLLILDEATSSLDSKSESLIQKTMHHLKGTTTIILIAHRLSTIREADTIFFMDKGKIIERGSHDELIELNGYYNNYVRLQSTN